MSPRKKEQQNHWKDQKLGDTHGYDKYNNASPVIQALLQELKCLTNIESEILDLGCNCGLYLSELKKNGFTHLSGLDISPLAIEYGKQNFDLNGITMHTGSFEEVIPQFIKSGIAFDLIYSCGATVELVHPSFDIVKSLCLLSKSYIVLFIQEWGQGYPRFWDYEFNSNGFFLIKCKRPSYGDFSRFDSMFRIADIQSLLVFKKLR